ncbi:MAG: hypothetical protein JWM16_5373 [Verrucomicrobiales bacterium]|nr:hypothetical protein [Verrucomicrobiales bacterium]
MLEIPAWSLLGLVVLVAAGIGIIYLFRNEN